VKDMKLLYYHAKNLRIEAGIPGKGLSQKRKAEARIRKKLGEMLPILDDKPTTSDNALLALVCVEKGDEEVDLAEVREDVFRARALLGVPEIVIGAFAHLSENAAEARIARKIIDDLVALCQTRYTGTKTFPFGWDKGLSLHVPLHHYNSALKIFGPVAGNIWDEIAGGYHLHMIRTGHYEAQYKLLDTLRKHICGYVLDVACGAGEALRYLHARQRDGFVGYVGIDSSKSMIELARKNSVLHDGYPANFTHGNTEEISGLFGTVLLLNAAVYVDLERLLEKLPKLMAPGAKLIIGEEDPFAPDFIEKCDLQIRKKLEVIKRRTMDELRRLIIAKGFTQIDEARVAIDKKHDLVGVVFEQAKKN